MDCVQAEALRTSFGPEMALKSTQQAFFDDGWCGNGPNVVASDDFFVDDLLNFSNEDVEQGFVVEGEKDCSSVSSQEAGDNDNSNTNSSAFSFDDDFGSVPGSELSVPADDLASLEWLSHFVDDSFDEFTLPSYPAENPTEKPHQNHQKENKYEEPQTETSFSLRSPYFPALVPAKKRSKRSRTSGRKAWYLGSPSSFTDSSSTTTTTSSSSSSSSSPTSCLTFTNRGQDLELFYCLGKPPLKKQNKKPASENSAGGSQLQRRCSHCHVQKTPQWRTGPLGAKTLCNACGVRYKSGRLLPEYRPACSPTFSNEIHSNNHRKVLEMRKKKEVVGPESGLTSAVQSF